MTSMKRGEAREALLDIFSALKQIDGIVVHDPGHDRMGDQHPFWIPIFTVVHECAARPSSDVEVFVGN